MKHKYSKERILQIEKQRNNPFYKKTFGAMLIVIAMFLSSNLRAQQASAFDTYLESLSDSARNQIRALAYDEQATVHVSATGISLVGNGVAQVLDVNASDLSTLNFNDMALSQVKFIRIRINSASELALNLDLSGASALSHLSFVLVMSAVDATAAQITDSVQGIPSGVPLCYSVSVPQ